MARASMGSGVHSSSNTLAGGSEAAQRAAAPTSARASTGTLTDRGDQLRVYGMLALGIMCIGFSAIFTRKAGTPGIVSGFYRFLIGEVALAPFVVRAWLRSRQGQTRSAGAGLRSRSFWLLAFGAGCFFMLDITLWNTSLFLTSAANATLLGNDAPIVVGLVAWLFLRERLRRAYWLGLGLALLGMGAIVGRDAFAHFNLIGDLLALGGGVSYAFYLLCTQSVRNYVDTLASLWIPCAFSTVLLFVVNLALHQQLWGFSGATWFYIGAVGLISQAVGWMAINYALGHLPASIISVTLLGQPVLTALLAVPLLGEQLVPLQIIGGLVALSGIYLVNRGVGRGAEARAVVAVE